MIATEKWVPLPDGSGKLVYSGQRTAWEVYKDLHTHLAAAGFLPDEYFLLDNIWRDGREFPEDGRLISHVDYGGSEGIYLDVTLEYEQNGGYEREHFVTGKTLGESDEDLDRMHLIASAITKAFHEDGLHARYAVAGGSTEEASEELSVQGILFSRVQLWTDTGIEDEFYMPGVPCCHDDLEDYSEFIDFTEFLAVADVGAKEITSVVTPFAAGGGAARDADQDDIDRIRYAAENGDVEIISGWRMGEKFDFTFDYVIDELFHQGIGGIE